MTLGSLILPTLLVLWLGTTLGGSLIVAPAKFTVDSLSLSTALEVGRAQFRWVAVAELVLSVGIVLATFLSKPLRLIWCALPIAIFALQWLAVMPALDERTAHIIAGENVGDSHLHGIYVVAEISKCVFLALAAFMIARGIIITTGQSG